MKRLYISISTGIISVFITGICLAQTVMTIPVYPVDTDSCKVIFDATQGNGELANEPPPLYAHTGVITSQSSNPSDWKYVIANWNENTEKARMTSLGNNLWQLRITPSIREFYGVPAGETIQKLAFVFRNSDGSKVGREANGGDIFADVYPDTFSINITSLTLDNLILQAQDSIPVSAVSPFADSMFLYVDNTLVKKVAGINITDTLSAGDFGMIWVKHQIRITAKNDTSTVSDSVSFQIVPDPSVAELPGGIIDGINYLDSATVTLCLYAPEKKFCFVIGDFTNWEADSLRYMYLTPDGKRFWLQITGLEPGKEYIFQYLVDGTLRIADPYTEKISDPDDQYISSSTYPGLLPYPTGKTTQIASILQTAQTPYPWDTGTFIPPAVTDLVIYEMLLRDFMGAHDYVTLEDTLDYLCRLGVNAVELMPVMEFEGNSSWGYNPDFLFAPDKYYGPANTLRHFVETAHQKGIAVILDIVLNHQFGQSPLVRLYWDDANDRPSWNSPWFNPIPKHPYNVGYDFNHDSPDTKAYCKRVLKHWITAYHIDGFRFDLSKGFTQVNSYPDDVPLWGNYDANRVSILNNYLIAMRSVKPDIILILEHFADNDEEKDLAEDGMLLWGNLNNPYAEAAMGYHSGGISDFSGISYLDRGWFYPHLTGYMESHDEERLMYKCLTWGNSQGYYLVQDTNTALKRIEMNASFFFTVPGPKMIWEFGELGYDYSIDWGGGRLSPKPPRWDYPNQWRRGYLNKVFATLISLKKNQDVFRTTNFTMDVSGSMKRINLNHSSMDVTIIGNFGVQSGNIIPQFQSSGTWYDYFSGDSISVSSLSDAITLSAGEYHLYTSKRLQKPAFTAIDEFPSPESASGKAVVFPNPFTDAITVMSDIPVTRLEVYHLTGILLFAIDNATRADLSGLPAGFYYLKIYYSDCHTAMVKLIKQ